MSLLVLAAATAAAIIFSTVLVLAVRRVMTKDTLVDDPDRSQPHYGLISTAFAVLLAFVVLTSFQSYNLAEGGAEHEAVAVTEIFRTGEFFPPKDRREFEGEAICLGRAAVAEWPAMRNGDRNAAVDDWVTQIRATTAGFQLHGPKQVAAFSHLLAEEDQRATGRRERLSEATPAVTAPVWFVLIVGGLTVIFTPLLFLDRREHLRVQAGLTAGVTVMVVTGLSLIWFLDHPYRDSSGSIKPTEMQRSLEIMGEESPGIVAPCSDDGTPA